MVASWSVPIGMGLGGGADVHLASPVLEPRLAAASAALVHAEIMRASSATSAMIPTP